MRSLALILMVALVGCGGPPPATVYSAHLCAAIRSAVARQSASELNQFASRARALRNGGQLTEDEYQALEIVFQKARLGDWAGAAQAAAEH